MDSFDIELFRAIISSRSITQASQALMLSQSAISQRLLRLEQELGIILIERQKGIRRVEITEQGMRFLELAEKWENSYQEILRLKDTEPDQSLVIASPDSLVNFVLGPFLKRLPELGYFPRLRTQQSLEIYDLVDNKEADVGFVFRDARYANIVTRSVLREPISMICRPGSPWKERAVHPQQLRKQDEIYLAWSPAVQQWHDYWWNPSTHPVVHVDTPAAMLNYLTPGTWAMCPESVVAAYRDNREIEIHAFAEKPPDRECFLILHKSPGSGRAKMIARFERHLDTFLRTLPYHV